jgi:hypothetical protein
MVSARRVLSISMVVLRPILGGLPYEYRLEEKAA